MAVRVVVDGVPVTLDTRLWSWDEAGNPVAPNSWIGTDWSDPYQLFRTQRALRQVTGFLARNIASVGLHAFQETASGDRERLPAARALPRLLASPSPTSTQFDWLKMLVLDVCLFDRYAAIIEVVAGRIQLRRVPPQMFDFERSVDNSPRSLLVFDADRGQLVSVPLSEVLWLDGFPSPDNTSPIAALVELLVEERESSRYRRQLWENGARFPGWVSRPADAPNWRAKPAGVEESGAERFRRQFREWESGGKQAGRAPVLEDGMAYHELSTGITPESAQQLETRKFSIAEVAAAYHIPPVIAGLIDSANYSNVSAYRNVLYADTLGPWFVEVAQAVNARLLPHPLVLGTSNAFVEFNVASKLQLSFDEQADIYSRSTGAPWMTRNEVRRRANLPALPGGDELVVPLNVLIGGQASPADSGSQNER